MKFFSDKIDRFCATHRRFGIRRLMTYIVAASAAVLILSFIDTRGVLLGLLSFDPGRVLRGEIWRAVTWILLPFSDNVFLSALTLYFYYFIGTTLEREWGAGKLTIFYGAGILLNAAYSLAMYATGLAGYIFPNPLYLNLSMFFAFATLFPDTRIMLFFIIPVKVKWLAWFDAALFAYSIYRYLSLGLYFFALVPVVAVLNFLLICGVPGARFLRARAVSNVINVNFKRASRDDLRETKGAAYRHKCEVCGRTDVSNPELQFRYCSRCEGFHCYCEEHIENHIHIV
ncbi:MAG: rhomboid family intramembrane serine protease [Oscillospiraceae bacterium]|nr:rhomboid family intramembrane serine protease [Oscillospiraceae bacterium]